jgi:hypothetical protein
VVQPIDVHQQLSKTSALNALEDIIGSGTGLQVSSMVKFFRGTLSVVRLLDMGWARVRARTRGKGRPVMASFITSKHNKTALWRKQNKSRAYHPESLVPKQSS